jgi:pimeloyl-ACP methyl ester carboxylesterase
MFSETRYALNGDLHVAYRASEGERDIVFVSNWITNCEVFPESPSIHGWVEAMTSLGRLIFFDQPGTGASDFVTADELPNMEQWADSITAVLDHLGSREAVLVAIDGAFAPAALFAATHPSRTTGLIALECYADPLAEGVGGKKLEEGAPAAFALWGTGETLHVTNPDMPWNEEIRAAWGPARALNVEPTDGRPHAASVRHLTGHQPEVSDDRVLATVLFTDIVDSTRRAADMGDRGWHALAARAFQACASRPGPRSSPSG